jgi:MFS transporter, MCT family, solute carrier family 16 (monocarboxylic acid transporters), member 14
VTYSFGLFIEEFVDFYGTGQGETAWIASILVGVTLCSGKWQKHSVKVVCSRAHINFLTLNVAELMRTSPPANFTNVAFTISGPVTSSLVNKYGCRPVTIAGAILASFCLAISVYAPNVTFLYLTIGLGTGKPHFIFNVIVQKSE